jgi:hypothetical protein
LWAVQTEQGESGTPHLQGFIILQRWFVFNSVKQLLSTERVHVELVRGTNGKAMCYCKKDGDFEEFSDLPAEQHNRPSYLDKLFSCADTFVESHGCIPMKQEIAAEYTKVLLLH